MQPRQYFMLMEKHKERARHAELLAGIISSTVANFSFNAPKKALSAAIFMPSEQVEKAPRAKRRTKRERENTASIMRAMLTARTELDKQRSPDAAV